MQINYTGQHIDVTPALKEYADQKFDKLARHADRIGNVHVIFSVEKLRQIVEATVHIAGLPQVNAHAESEDMYHSIGLLIDKLDRQLIKLKEKTND